MAREWRRVLDKVGGLPGVSWRTGTKLDLAEIFLSTLYCVSYIIQTYSKKGHVWLGWWLIDIALAGIFTCDHLVRRFRWAAVPLRLLVIDCMVILPVLPVSFFVSDHTLWFGDGFWRLVFPARFLRLNFWLSSLLYRHDFLPTLSDLQRSIARTVAAFGCFLLFVAGCLQITESGETLEDGQQAPLSFYDALFAGVLIYLGNSYTLNADNELTKTAVILLILFLALYLPQIVEELMGLLSAGPRQYGAFNPQVSGSDHRHVVVVGDSERFHDFVLELLHQDRARQKPRIVMISDEPPTPELLDLMRRPYEKRLLCYFKESASVSALQKTCVQNAVAAFVLTGFDALSDHRKGRTCGDTPREMTPLDSDVRTVFLSAHIRALAPSLDIFSEVLSPRSIPTATQAGATHIISVDELCSSVMALNVACPGMAAFIFNLFLTESGVDVSDLEPNSTMMADCEKEYWYGVGHEVYSMECPRSFIGASFRDVYQAVMCHHHATVIAVADSRVQEHGVRINPGAEYIFTGRETVCVIAQDQTTVDAVARERTLPYVPSRAPFDTSGSGLPQQRDVTMLKTLKRGSSTSIAAKRARTALNSLRAGGHSRRNAFGAHARAQRNWSAFVDGDSPPHSVVVVGPWERCLWFGESYRRRERLIARQPEDIGKGLHSGMTRMPMTMMVTEEPPAEYASRIAEVGAQVIAGGGAGDTDLETVLEGTEGVALVVLSTDVGRSTIGIEDLYGRAVESFDTTRYTNFTEEDLSPETTGAASEGGDVSTRGLDSDVIKTFLNVQSGGATPKEIHMEFVAESSIQVLDGTNGFLATHQCDDLSSFGKAQAYAAGFAFARGLAHRVMPAMFYSPIGIGLLSELTKPSRTGVVVLVAVDKALIEAGCCYEDLCAHEMDKRGLLVVALHRRVIEDNATPGNHSQSYILTSPPPYLYLRPGDCFHAVTSSS